MKLNKQLSILAAEAPGHGVPTTVMEQAVIPVLKAFAQQVTSLKYYIMKNSQGDLLITQLAHREKKDLKKTAIYAFLNPQDGQRFYDNDFSLVAEEVPVTHLLFQLFALEAVDSLIFLDDSPNLLKGKEIKREEIRTAILQQVQKLNPTYSA